ncbi:DUF6531 domain-containing protein [Dongshaea marina]|uniref:DUF6531 domain-containing protein n=1 Tax=Dongshaea marina TaxID=2047966 RepID=UPI000D3E4611|nr:RHS domain-containing protein [Dongshaea marina]
MAVEEPDQTSTLLPEDESEVKGFEVTYHNAFGQPVADVPYTILETGETGRTDSQGKVVKQKATQPLTVRFVGDKAQNQMKIQQLEAEVKPLLDEVIHYVELQAREAQKEFDAEHSSKLAKELGYTGELVGHAAKGIWGAIWGGVEGVGHLVASGVEGAAHLVVKTVETDIAIAKATYHELQKGPAAIYHDAAVQLHKMGKTIEEGPHWIAEQVRHVDNFVSSIPDKIHSGYVQACWLYHDSGFMKLLTYFGDKVRAMLAKYPVYQVQQGAEIVGGFIGNVIVNVLTDGAGAASTAALAAEDGARVAKAMEAAKKAGKMASGPLFGVPMALVKKLFTRLKKVAELIINSHLARDLVVKPAEKLVTKTKEAKLFKKEAARIEHAAKDERKIGKVAENANGKPSLQEPKVKCANDPISTFSGEELLRLVDYELPGPIEFNWLRTYRTASSQMDGPLGFGWSSRLNERLAVHEGRLNYFDAEGRKIEIPIPWQQPTRNSRENYGARRLEWGDEAAIAIRLPDDSEQIFTLVDERWLPQAIVDSFGNNLSYHYQDGRLTELRGSWGRGLALEWHDGRVISVSPLREGACNGELEWRSLPPVVHYHYDEAGDLIRVRDRLGLGDSYQYSNHLFSKRTLASGFNYQFEWDRDDQKARCLRVWGDSDYYDYRFSWFPEENKVTYTDGRSLPTTDIHDDSGQVIQTIHPDGAIERFEYDGNGNQVAHTNADGYTTYSRYDDENRLVEQINPLGQSSHLQFDAAGNPNELTDASGNSWQRFYNPQGLLEKTIDPEGNTTSYQYNELGYPTLITAPDGTEQRLLWNRHGDLVAESLLAGGWQKYRYDEEARVTAIEFPDGRAQRYAYDPKGRPVIIQAADGSQQQLKWDACDRLVSITDGEGRTTSYEYADGLAQITRRIAPDGSELNYRYDAERNLVSLTNEKGEEYRFSYDAQERLVEEICFDGRIQSYDYSPAGQLLAAHQQHSNHALRRDTTRFMRDPLGRLQQKQLPDGMFERFAYDQQGNLTLAQNHDATLEFSYSPSGNLLRESQNGQSLSHNYDALGQRTQTITPDGDCIEYGYQLGMLHETRLNGKLVSQHNYDELGRETHRQQGSLTSHYQYDQQSRLASHRAMRGEQQVLGREYGYYASGALRSIKDSRNGFSEFFYDRADRLTRVTGPVAENFVYDPAGNLLAEGESNPANTELKQNRLLCYGDKRYRYNDYGSLIEESGPSGTTRYQYDTKQQLVRVDNNGQQTCYKYDPLGRRIAKLTPQGETCYIWDGDVLLTESCGEKRKLYLHEPGSFRPLAQVVDGKTYHYQLDHLGTPRELTDAEGNIVWSVQYKAFGSVVCKQVEDVENNIRFQGQYFDSETGLHYNRHRYYNPRIGRYLSQDPLGLEGGAMLTSTASTRSIGSIR